MKKLSISKAHELLKRELGISTTNLEMPQMMNQNPKYPWYELRSGNLLVELNSTLERGNILIRLNMSFNDGRGGITRYFYGDTLEEAPEFIERDHWDKIVEQAESCEYNRETMRHRTIRLDKAARDAYRNHAETVQLRNVVTEHCAQASATAEPDELEKY